MSDNVAYPKWSTVRSLLDDPNVSGADKTRLLQDYAHQAAYDSPRVDMVNQDYVDHSDEIADYADKYGATDSFRDVTATGDGLFVDRAHLRAYQQATQRKFQDQLARAEDSQAVSQAGHQLTSVARSTVAQGGAGAATSDDILRPGAHGCDYFQYFIPPYRDWTGGAPDLRRDIRDVYDNLRGIQLAHFRADATQLSTSHGKLSDSALNLSAATGSLGGFWQGSAADAAQRYCGSFVRHAHTAADGIEAASKVITASMKAIETAVLQRAQGVLPLFATDVGGVPPEGVQALVDIARHKANDDDLRAVASWRMFSDVDWGDTDCHGNLSQNVRNLAAADATNWLNNTFVPNFDQKKQSFDSITKSTHDTVGQTFDAMNKALAKINANPFADLGKGIQVDTDSGSAGSGGTVSGGAGGAAGGGGGTVSAGAPAGGGGTVSGGPTSVPPPTDGSTPDPSAPDPTQAGVTDPAQPAGTAAAGFAEPDPSTYAAPDPSGGAPDLQPTTLAAASTAGMPDSGLGGGVATGMPDSGLGGGVATGMPDADLGGGVATGMPDADLGGGVAAGALAAGGGGLGGDVTGGVVDGGQAVSSHMVAAHHPGHDVFGGGVTPPGHAGVAGTNVTPIGQPGGAGLASAPAGALNQGGVGGQDGQGGGAAGMPMMPMGGMGGGQGGDQQRSGHSQWRTFGQLFDDVTDDTIGGFSGTLEDGR